MLEEDSQNLLRFMASNGLVANPSKTAFMVLNLNKEEKNAPITIRIGNENVLAEDSAKLLGISIDNNQKWHTQINGTGGTISSLNSRLFMLRRLARVISKDRLKKIADSLYTSKLRYGIQLFGKVRLSASDSTEGLLESLQIAQNRFARFMHGSKLIDRINNHTIYNEINVLSVNQLNAQTKLLEVWKALQDPKYPTQWERRSDVQKRSGLKTSNKPELITNGNSRIQENTFYNDAAQLWNAAPKSIKNCKTAFSAKKQIKLFVKSLPL